jgi:fumarylpyruvate hydrolase
LRSGNLHHDSTGIGASAMTAFCFAPEQTPSVAVAGSAARFPVHRIYCVGRNYAAHVREMGADPARQAPVFFMKPADALVANGAAIPYPQGTANLHHEIELVVALASGGRGITPAQAGAHVFGYAAGNDLTRRDLQNAAKEHGQPWDSAKGFDHSAPLAALCARVQGEVRSGRIWLKVNGVLRQEADVAQMLWDVPHIIAALSQLYELKAGDLIFTGTPAGVGALRVGDQVEGGIEGLEVLRHSVAAALPTC